MPRQDDILQLPSDLPVPVDDGLANHLPGMPVASVPLLSTRGEEVDFSTLRDPNAFRQFHLWRPGARMCLDRCGGTWTPDLQVATYQDDSARRHDRRCGDL